MSGIRTFLALCILSCGLTVIGMAIQQPLLFGVAMLLIISSFIEASTAVSSSLGDIRTRLSAVLSAQGLDRTTSETAVHSANNTAKLVRELGEEVAAGDRETTKKIVELMGQIAKMERRLAALEGKEEDPRF